MKKLSFTISFLFTILLSFGQISPFSKVINSLSSDGIQTYASCQNNSGSTVLVGIGIDGTGLIVQIDKNGELIWNKTWNFLNSNGGPTFTSVIYIADDGYFISGFCYSNEEEFTVYAKLDMNGDTIWTKTNTISSVYSAIQTNDNGFIMFGTKKVPGPIYNQLSILKVDSNGDYEWSKSYTYNNKSSHGYSIKQKENGNYVIVGKITEEDNNRNSGFLSELNSMGDILWVKTYFDELNNRDTDAYDFQIIDDSIYILLNGWNSIIAKTDLSGNLDWAKEINGTNGYNSMLYSSQKLKKTDNNHLIFISGSEFSDYSKVDLNANSVLNGWMEINATDIFSTEDDGILVVGNGPLMGVKTDFWRFNIGLIQIDETGYGIECVESGTSSSSLIELASNTIIFQEQSGGQPTSAQFEIGTLDLTMEDGCVDFVGGFEELNQNQIETYPNPAKNTFQIASENMQNGILNIFSADGKLIKNYRSLSIPNQLDISDLKNGLYFYQYETDDNQLFNGKFTVLR